MYKGCLEIIQVIAHNEPLLLWGPLSKHSYTFYSCVREPACSTTPASKRVCYSTHFSLLWLQLAPSMHQGPALIKAMQACQILIQIAVLLGFTPTASLAQFSPSQPSPLLISSFALHCLHAWVCCIVCSPLKGHGSGLLYNPHLSGPLGLGSLCVFMCIFSTC